MSSPEAEPGDANASPIIVTGLSFGLREAIAIVALVALVMALV